MGGADMQKADLSNLKLISKKMTHAIDQLYLKKGWTLITRSGTIGQTVFTNANFENKTATEDVIRVIADPGKIKPGFLHAFLASKYGYSLLTQSTYGAVIQHIEPHHIADLPVPLFPPDQQQRIHELIVQAAELRVEGNRLLREAEKMLMEHANLPDLNKEDYEYFGAHSGERATSTFQVGIKEVSSLTINAFNYSRKISQIKKNIKQKTASITLAECLNDDGIFTTGSFKRLELDSPKSIQLINQSDIFNIKKTGKSIARIFAKTENLVKYGEVLIAGVGTLGENETFCRCVFANEELEGQLISGEFLRMNTNNKVPSGYLFTYLSSPYGFRLIRSTHSGTKLCRPIKELLKDIPVPILDDKIMSEIDHMVKKSHNMRYRALLKENQAITLIETEIASWQS
jgi:type I restriction enzyme S subunit